MSTRDHVHEEEFPVPAEQLFALLLTPSAIRGWWGASAAIVLPEVGGTWAARWGAEDDPDYLTIARIRALDSGARLVLGDYQYFAKEGGLPFEAEFETEFQVSPTPDGATLRVTQRGFPAGSEADEYHAACQQGWRDTFAGIRRFLELGD